MMEGILCCKMIAGLKLCVDFRNYYCFFPVQMMYRQRLFMEVSQKLTEAFNSAQPG